MESHGTGRTDRTRSRPQEEEEEEGQLARSHQSS